MKITWHSHSCFELEESMNVLVDPYIENNPVARATIEEFNPDLIAITHAHADHMGNAAEISRRTGCMVIGVPEVARYLNSLGARAEGMNIGGTFQAGGITFRMTQALHSCGITGIDPPLYGGTAAGYIIEDGVVVYHAGDTGIFGDMRLIGELYRPEVALIPIGSRYTMGPREAAIATNWVRPEVAIPMHYNTYPSIQVDPLEYQALVETLCDTEVLILEIGETIEY